MPPLPPAAPARARAGIALFMLAMLVFTVMDTVAKALVGTYPVLQVLWLRLLVHGLALLVICPKPGLAARLATPLLPWHVLRAAGLALTAVLFYLGLRYVPLAEAMTLVCASPFITAVLAVMLLSERMTRARWWSMAIGFGGVLVVFRPGLGVAQWAALLPLLAGAAFSVQALVTRRLAAREDAWTILLLTPLLGALGVAPFALAGWRTPALPQLAGMGLIGLLAVASDAALMGALRLAPASIVAPFQYTQIVWAAVLGYLVFAETPHATTLAGAALIVASGVLLLRIAEARKAR